MVYYIYKGETALQVGISTASLFSRCNLEDAPKCIAALGGQVCEVFLNTFSEYEEEFIDTLIGELERYRLSVYSVHPMGTQFEPQLFSLYARQRKDATAIFEKVLRAGKSMGAKYYTMHGPGSMGGTAKNMELNRIGPIVKDLCQMAGEFGVTLAWENVSWCLYNYPEFGPRLLDAANTGLLRFTLDIKQAARSGYEPLSYAKSMRGYIANVHICDYKMIAGRAIPMLPGKGECDFLLLHEQLKGMDYGGVITYEVYSDLYGDYNELMESYTFVKNCFS